MKSCALALTAALALAGCGAIILPDSAIMPRTASGTPEMSDQGAMETAAYSLGVHSRTAGRPGEAARALAAIDFLAGDLYSNPHWTGFPAQTKQQMLQGRLEVRQVLAVAPGTPSQVVVDGLIRAADAFDAHQTDVAYAALPPAVFTLGPQRTLAVLADLPNLPQANIAAQNANAFISFDCNNTGECG